MSAYTSRDPDGRVTWCQKENCAWWIEVNSEQIVRRIDHTEGGLRDGPFSEDARGAFEEDHALVTPANPCPLRSGGRLTEGRNWLR